MRAISSARAPLTSPEEIRNIRTALGEVPERWAFLTHTRAEPFRAVPASGARHQHRVLVVKVSDNDEHTVVSVLPVRRLAGRFGDPRSRNTEPVGGGRLPGFRGFLDNSLGRAARRAHPPRLLGTRRTARQVFAEPRRPGRSTASERFRGRTTSDGTTRRHSGLWTGRERLVPDYEESLTRWGSWSGQWCVASMRSPWAGARANRPDDRHVVFRAGVSRPVVCEVGPGFARDDLVRVGALSAPDQVPGRRTFVRLGAGAGRHRLPKQARAVRRTGPTVVWSCDPVHADAVRTRSGFKTRHYGDIVDEWRGFVDVLAGLSEWPGGVHLEVAADDVTEYVGGGPDVESLPRAHRSLCDPCLNTVQASSLAREIADPLSGVTEDLSTVARLAVVARKQGRREVRCGHC